MQHTADFDHTALLAIDQKMSRTPDAISHDSVTAELQMVSTQPSKDVRPDLGTRTGLRNQSFIPQPAATPNSRRLRLRMTATSRFASAERTNFRPEYSANASLGREFRFYFFANLAHECGNLLG
jgi:hypothetical protein